MNATITIHDLLRIFLYLAGTGALIYFALVLRNVVKLTGTLQDLLEENEVGINETLKAMPGIANNTETMTKDMAHITNETAELIDEVKPEVQKLASAVSGVSDTVDGVSRKVDETTSKVTDTVVDISDSISDAAKTISVSANNVMDYFYILKEVVEAVRDIIFSR